jgi:3-hydroxyacyl-CoA dehydrogenase
VTEARQGRVAIVGSGLMGAQIGAEYALGAYEVVLVTRSQETARRSVERAREALRHLVGSGLAAASAAEGAEARLQAGQSVAEASQGAWLVVESLPEDMDLKVRVLSQAVQAEPDALIASNTSSLSIGELGRRLGAEERTLGTHYWNPPTLMPLVEVVSGPSTARAALERVEAVLRRLGKEPVRAPDIPGFIWNRLQLALLREAVGMVQAGEADAETIDLILTRGLGRRWSLVGPFQAVALGGPATFAAVAEQLWPRLHQDVLPQAMLEMPLPQAEKLSALHEARDRALAALLRAERAEQTGSLSPPS